MGVALHRLYRWVSLGWGGVVSVVVTSGKEGGVGKEGWLAFMSFRLDCSTVTFVPEMGSREDIGGLGGMGAGAEGREFEESSEKGGGGIRNRAAVWQRNLEQLQQLVGATEEGDQSEKKPMFLTGLEMGDAAGLPMGSDIAGKSSGFWSSCLIVFSLS